jgi:peptide/nickel transport system substrate-binding protein
MTRAWADEVGAWRYEPPFDVYNGDDGSVLLDGNHLAILDDGVFVGCVATGLGARVRGGPVDDGDVLDVGIGLAPDVLGHGLGTRAASLAIEALRVAGHRALRASILASNERSTTPTGAASWSWSANSTDPGPRSAARLRSAPGGSYSRRIAPWPPDVVQPVRRTAARPRRGVRAAALALVAALALGALVAVQPSGATASWTITVAAPETGAPLWAFPFLSGDELDAQNVQDFEQLTYRPLYFFDGTTAPTLDPRRSLADPPVYANGDTTVSVTMKPGLEWSNGEPVSARGVVAWMNLDASFPGLWADYLAPLRGGRAAGLPDDVESIAVSGATVTFTLSGPVDPTWFTDNELSQITPLPAAWDRYEPSRPKVPMVGPESVSAHGGHFTAPTASAGCYGDTWVGDGNHGPSDQFVDPLGDDTVVQRSASSLASRCVDEVELMRSLSADATDYTVPGTDVSETWELSDGPWRLSEYDAATGALTLVANTAPGAAGPRPTAAALEFVPCATAAACAGLLADGDVDQGELPVPDAPRTSSLAAAPRHNPLAGDGYRETVTLPWAIDYVPYNFDSVIGAGGHAGAVLDQLVVRQALQSLDDQSAMVDSSLRGYGAATDAPVPAVGAPFDNPYPFDVGRARSLLATHGWSVRAGGLTRCAVAARCGSGIPKGTPLALTIVYASQGGASTASLELLRADAREVGIELRLERLDPSEVLDRVLGHRGDWDLASWDGGWSYAPDYFASGEWLFAAGSPWNVGGYDAPEATTLVEATMSSASSLGAYDAYIADQLPVLWQPVTATITETRAAVRGVVVSSDGAFTPESWRLATGG